MNAPWRTDMLWLWYWDALLGRAPHWAVTTADAGDADELAAIHAASFARGWSVEEMESLLRDRAVVASVLHREGRSKPKGFALSRIAADEAEVLSVAVIERRRGQGGGKALFGRHLGQLAAAGARRVALEVDEDNAAAIRLYESFGFQKVGRRAAYYQRADGGRASALVLALDMA